MRLSCLPLYLRLFLLLVVTVLFIQLPNVMLVLICPPAPETSFSLGQLRDALEGRPMERLGIRTVDGAELRPQDEALEPARQRIADGLGLPPQTLRLEFALPPSWHAARADKGIFDAERLFPREAPRAGALDIDGLIFSGDFRLAHQLEDRSWRVASPRYSVMQVWRIRALTWLLGTVLFAFPAAWVLARWLSRPIRQFGKAAERLGRNPRATPLSLDGPAEIHGAAQAFNEMTERISRYVDDRMGMMAAIAHDLRTPLTRLSFRLERAPDDIRGKGEADIAEMMGMLAAVLAFVQSTQSDRPRRQQELRSLLTSIADDQADMGRDVTVEEGPDIVLIGDDQGLRSLFTNLVENAVAYGGNASIRLRRQGGEAIVEVEDEGPGLPAEELERVFEPFYRAEPSRNRATGGIGLGLALVRSVAVAHGGYALLENRLGRGLQARIALPI
jgi:two-component system OmpR family sensor kinase